MKRSAMWVRHDRFIIWVSKQAWPVWFQDWLCCRATHLLFRLVDWGWA